MGGKAPVCGYISIHALREEGDLDRLPNCNCATDISIHALREEGDNDTQYKFFPVGTFLSTPSARRATEGMLTTSGRKADFYPRPPRGGRQIEAKSQKRKTMISIHALREEGDLGATIDRLHRAIFLSTPSARRATSWHGTGQHCSVLFLSTPSARRATAAAQTYGSSTGISIHALREEGDLTFEEERHLYYLFLSTPSARRAT